MIHELPGHEEWRVIQESDLYEVSNLGQVRSWAVPGSTRRAEAPRLLSPTVYKNGYRSIHVRVSDGPRRLLYVHRLVATAFHGPAPVDMSFVRHLDGSRLNNTAENLRWGTVAENQRDMVIHGNSLAGERSHWAKLTEEQVRAIRRADWATDRALAAHYGVSVKTIERLRRGETWRGVA